jgi:hypothetical protein
MGSSRRVFINEVPVEVPAGSSGWDAVAIHDPQLAAAARAAGYLTDGVGREIDGSEALSPGAIVRVVVSSSHDREE